MRDIDGYLRSLKTIGHFKETDVRLEGWFTADELRQIAEKLQQKGASHDTTRPIPAPLLQQGGH